MKVLLFVLPLILGVLSDNYCYNKVQKTCASHTSQVVCNANYGGFSCMEDQWNDLLNNHLMRSNEYLLVSTHFNTYESARKGFVNLFGQLSDSKWELAKRIIRYIATRDGEVVFAEGKAYRNGEYGVFELEALAMTVDYEKQLAIDVNNIHKVSTGTPKQQDLDVTWELQNNFAMQQMGVLRARVGEATELLKMSDSDNYQVATEKFDDYLQGVSI